MTQEVLVLRSSFRPRAVRAAQFTIAFIMLAVPAEAFAFSGTADSSDTPSSTPLPVRVTPRHVRLGAPVHVTGRLPSSAAGTTVELQSARSAHGRWRRVARTRVGARGGYSLHAAPRHSALLRAVSLSGASGPTAVAARAARSRAARPARARPRTHRSAVARIAAVQVKAAVHVARRARGVVAGHGVSVAGRLLPAAEGRSVAVQRRARHAWRTVARARAGGRGGFEARFRPAAGAHGTLRVVFAGDRANGRATAAAGVLSVYEPVTVSWYDDYGTTACGFHATYGIANRSLPCGTHVRLRHGGHTVTATVDDRGPYVYGREYDLSQTTAGALGFSGVGTIDASVQ